MKIYDCFPFFNELDLLELRLEIMYPYVDKFIISECDYTFSGIKKPFYFEENKDRYEKYMDKIIHLKHFNTDNYLNPLNVYEGKQSEIFEGIRRRMEMQSKSEMTGFGLPHWCRDYFHKELLLIGMDICENDDIIMFSDCDEIPYLKNFVFSEDSFLLSQKNMIYYFNYENKTEKWFGTYITKFSNLINGSIHDTRNIRGSFKIVENAGWHFTWFGGKDKMTEKLISYGHQEYNNQQKKDNITNFESPTNDILSRNINIEKINLSEYYPTEILEIINNKFKHLIFEN